MLPATFLLVTMFGARPRLLSRLRLRKSLESSFFITTFVVALLTVSVSASSMLPCPANRADTGMRHAHAEDRPKHHAAVDREEMPVGGLGQRAYLTKQGGWIEIDQRPSLFSWRRWAQ